MDKIINISDIVLEDGRTIRDKNNEKKHELPLYTLVEVNIPNDAHHGIRLFVQSYSRDCDGTPLYNLTYDLELVGKGVHSLKDANSKEAFDRDFYLVDMGKILTHYSIDSLVVIRDAKETIDKLISTGYLDENFNWLA